MANRQSNCFQCVYYYVTWDSFRPRGCRALGFKCRELPSQAVRRASGEVCLYFRRKARENERES